MQYPLNSLVRSLCRDPLIAVYRDFVSVPSNTARGKARHNLFESLISVLPVTMWVLPGQNCWKRYFDSFLLTGTHCYGQCIIFWGCKWSLRSANNFVSSGGISRPGRKIYQSPELPITVIHIKMKGKMICVKTCVNPKFRKSTIIERLEWFLGGIEHSLNSLRKLGIYANFQVHS